MNPCDGEQGQTRFRALYDESLPRVFRYVSRALAPNLAECDDLVAEVYLVAWRRFDDIPSPPADLLWLFGVARNVVAHHRRSTARRGRLQERLHMERPVQDADLDFSNRVMDAVEHLPRREREALHLVVWEGLTSTDAAKVVGCSPNAIRIRVHRARRRLTERLAIIDPPVDPDFTASVLNWELPQ
jgi:RNA polymerase sigma-70 factor, ECF subfamily